MVHRDGKNTTSYEESEGIDQSGFDLFDQMRKFFAINRKNGTLGSKQDDVNCSPMITSTHIIDSIKQRRSIIAERSEKFALRTRSIEKDETIPLCNSPKNYSSFNRVRGLSQGDDKDYRHMEERRQCFTESTPIHSVKYIEDGLEQKKINLEKTDVLDAIKKKTMEGESSSFAMSVLYGMVNTAVVLPVIMSFGSIIYHDPFFRPYLPILIKLTVISGIVHQIVFSTFSSLPFAVGQVQDAGLIFLSAMASDIVRYCKERDYDDESVLATCTIGLSIFTAILGIALVIIGKLELVSIVQKLPTSVVGGYLAFIGFFCGQSGLSIMSGVDVPNFLQWYKFMERDAFVLLLPGVIGGLAIYLLVRYIKHASVLPICIIAIVIFFYSVLNMTGMTLEEARSHGWVNNSAPPPVWYHSWDYLRIDKVVWSALPSQTVTVLSMIGVVALSSSLDVAAIELDLGSPLNYNAEINTVGISNLLSGLTGGYTGSYIFSQTIFSMRSGIRSRWCGYVIAMNEFISVILPFSVLAYLPNFFFGSLLIMISVDLMWEWLWDVRDKVTKAEYFVAWSSFILIQILGVEYGILGGIFLYVIGKKIGCDMGEEPRENEEMIESKMYLVDSHGMSLVNFLNNLKSQISLAASHMSSSSENGGNEESGNENTKTQENLETHESLMV